MEDNWESPVLGAWGLGWEVWLDGMEVTQFTYFQQSGGQPCRPVAVEITYGLERILMALQVSNRPPYSLPYSRTRPPAHSLTHSRTHSLAHSLARASRTSGTSGTATR